MNSDRLAAAVATAVPSDDVFRLLVASVRDYAIFMLDTRGTVASWNLGAERITGYTAGDIIGHHFSAFYPDDDVRAGKCERELELAARDGRFEDENWRVRKDGTRYWSNVVITALRDDTGTLVGFGKVTRDVSARKRAETAQERFRLLVETVRDYAIFLLDPGGYVATWNAGAQQIKGYTADEIIGRHFSVFYTADEVASGKCEHELEVAGGPVGRFEDEGWRVRKDGSQFWANVIITALRDDSGALIGFSKVTRDLTDRKRGEDERAARVAAEQANRAKDQFLAMLGHELRNPLAPIVTALQLIKLRDDRRSRREHEIIERQVNHMVRLVDDLLDVSRITAGKIVLSRRQLDIRDVIAKAIESTAPLFEERRHHLEVKAPRYPILVDGDEGRLVQVISNLLTNAAKYTEPGGHVFVIVRRGGVGGVGDDAVVEVRDDGTGISAELLPRVFELFVQGAQSSDRGPGGLGLGLALVQSLVHLHGGNVAVRSDGPGHGSSFTVRLPAIEQPVAVARTRTPKSGFPMSSLARRILLVDDNEDARMLLGEILGALGHQVVTAGDGPAALEAVKEFTPEVAVLDIGLPGMDGFALAAELRGVLAEPPYLIALSGYGQQSDRERGRGAGFDHYLVKPVDVRSLLTVIDGISSDE
nr:PAS domain S-box protein [Kofleriaceae bacterium]